MWYFAWFGTTSTKEKTWKTLMEECYTTLLYNFTPWVFFTFFNLRKRYQIAQSVSYRDIEMLTLEKIVNRRIIERQVNKSSLNEGKNVYFYKPSSKVTAQKMQLWLWSHSLKKSLMENIVFCVLSYLPNGFHCYWKSAHINCNSSQLLLLGIGEKLGKKSGRESGHLLRIGKNVLQIWPTFTN